MKTPYRNIKETNGLAFVNAMRAKDSGLFDIPNVDGIVRYAGRDARPVLPYLNSLKDIKIDEEVRPKESYIKLLARAGYDAYLANTHAKHIAISRYYHADEKICFFDDPERVEKYYIINAIKKNADELLRDDFPEPDRNDEYGESVFSIHILKTGGVILITNRHNHSVKNPDNTFGCNPDNIIPGLSYAIKRDLKVDFSSPPAEVPEGFVVMGGNLLKYNYEVNGVYFGDNFWAKDGEIYALDTAREAMLDYFVLDLHAKKLTNPSGAKDAFFEVFSKEAEGKKIPFEKIGKTRRRFYLKGDGRGAVPRGEYGYVETDGGRITSLSLTRPLEIGDGFMSRNDSLTDISLESAQSIGCGFLENNTVVSSAPHLPNVEKIGLGFLRRNPYNRSETYHVGDAAPQGLKNAVLSMARSMKSVVHILPKLFDRHPELYGMLVRYAYDQHIVQWPFFLEISEARNFIEKLVPNIKTMAHFRFFTENKMFRDYAGPDILWNHFMMLLDAEGDAVRKSGSAYEIEVFRKSTIGILAFFVLRFSVALDMPQGDKWRIMEKLLSFSDVLGQDAFSFVVNIPGAADWANMNENQVRLLLPHADFSSGNSDAVRLLSQLCPHHKTKEVFEYVAGQNLTLARKYFPDHAGVVNLYFAVIGNIRGRIGRISKNLQK